MLPSDSSAVLNPPMPAKRSMKVVSASRVVLTGITVAVPYVCWELHRTLCGSLA